MSKGIEVCQSCKKEMSLAYISRQYVAANDFAGSWVPLRWVCWRHEDVIPFKSSYMEVSRVKSLQEELAS